MKTVLKLVFVRRLFTWNPFRMSCPRLQLISLQCSVLSLIYYYGDMDAIFELTDGSSYTNLVWIIRYFKVHTCNRFTISIAMTNTMFSMVEFIIFVVWWLYPSIFGEKKKNDERRTTDNDDRKDDDDDDLKTSATQAIEVLNAYFYSSATNQFVSVRRSDRGVGETMSISISQVSNWFGNKRIRYKKNIANAQEEANLYAGTWLMSTLLLFSI